MRIAETGEIEMTFVSVSQGGKWDRYEGTTKSGRLVVQYLPNSPVRAHFYKTIVTIETTQSLAKTVQEQQLDVLKEINDNLKNK